MSDPFSAAIYVLNSLLSGLYIQKLLPCRYRRMPVLLLWVAVYFSAQLLRGEITGVFHTADVLLRIAVGFAAFLAMGMLLYRGERTMKLFAALSFTAGSEIVRFISSAVYSILSKQAFHIFSRDVAYTAAGEAAVRMTTVSNILLAVSILLQFAILGAYLSIITKQIAPPPAPLRVHEKLVLTLPACTVLCIAVTLQLLVISVESGMSIIVYDTIPATRLWIPLICLLLLSTVLSSAYLFQKMLQGHEEEKRRILLENQMAQIQGEVAEIQDIYADMRSLRHDLRGHLANISALIHEKAPDDHDLPEYVGKMESTLARLDLPFGTGDPITDIVLRRKCQEAEKKQIPLQIDFLYPAGQKIDAYDIGIILNNALENAMEACGSVDGAKGVLLRSYVKGNLFFIEVENDFAGEIVWNEKTGLPASGKKDTAYHGVGLSSIRRCAQKYNGDMDIDISHTQGRSIFRLTVMMCGKDLTPENQ